MKDIGLKILIVLLTLSLVITGCQSTEPENPPVSAPEQVNSPVASTEVPVEAAAITEAPVPVEETGPKYGGKVSYAYTSEPLTLDCRQNMATSGGQIAYQVQEGLLGTDPITGKAAPALAEEWNISDDGLVYTFKLRQGVKFHDGTDFDASDVVYTFSFLTGEREGSLYTTQFSPFIESVEATDSHTVVVTLTKPWSDFETHLRRNWGTLMLSEDAVEKAGENYGLTVMVGTGPFKFVSWKQGEPIVLVRNDEYWNAPYPYLDEVEYRPISDASARLISLQSGIVDIIGTPPIDQLAGIRDNPDLRIDSVPGNPMASIQFNTADKPFNDVKLRQALSYLLDREALTKAFFGEYAVVAKDLFPLWHPFYDPSFEGFPHDPEKGLALLEEAGYSSSNPLKFVAITTTDTNFQRLLVFMQAQLLEYGIEMEIRPLESNVRLSLTEGKEGFNRDDYDLAVQSQTLPGSTTDDYIYKFYSKDGSLNRTFYNKDGGYQNLEMEDLIQKARSTADLDEQQKLYREIINILCEEVALIPIYYEQNVSVLNTRVQDYYMQSTVNVPFTQVWVNE
jgi:ABC-type transport system substrate-binding protein